MSSSSQASQTVPVGGESIHLGARTVVSKSLPVNDLISVVRRLSAGLPVSDADQRAALIDYYFRSELARRRDARTRLRRLTPREQQILGQLMKGQNVDDIARADVLSVATIRTHVKSILAKLDVSSQIGAVGLAYGVHWRTPAGHISAPTHRWDHPA